MFWATIFALVGGYTASRLTDNPALIAIGAIVYGATLLFMVAAFRVWDTSGPGGQDSPERLSAEASMAAVGGWLLGAPSLVAAGVAVACFFGAQGWWALTIEPPWRVGVGWLLLAANAPGFGRLPAWLGKSILFGAFGSLALTVIAIVRDFV